MSGLNSQQIIIYIALKASKPLHDLHDQMLPHDRHSDVYNCSLTIQGSLTSFYDRQGTIS